MNSNNMKDLLIGVLLFYQDIIFLEMVTQKQQEITSSRLLMVKAVQGVGDLSTMLTKYSQKVS